MMSQVRIGQIRVIRSNAVQDGLKDLHIVAGQAAMDHARNQESILALLMYSKFQQRIYLQPQLDSSMNGKNNGRESKH